MICYEIKVSGCWSENTYTEHVKILKCNERQLGTKKT